ncbi:MAG TPA: N-acetylneuraminate synthase family protein [Solirubrobacteraceae bacterium]|jgi:N-acetylneuraminate synthase/N,N'-diacetyllegionaminate synthase|nr:N-acetylneuraminate synthase family protein [Solirubrobacteraceae bacterium]
MSRVTIGEHRVGRGEPVLVVAEVGVNHDGDLATALELVDAAAAAGAGAVKLQTFVPATLAVSGAPLASYQRAHTGVGADQHALLERLCLSIDELEAVSRRCELHGVLFFSTPFDMASAALLERFDPPAFKVASGELTNLAFLQALAARGRPLVLSTGMASLSEVREAVRVIRDAGTPLVLLHCVSSYPTPPDQANVRAIDTLRDSFGVPVGYSDHCLGLDASLAAVARDACLVERHITLDRTRRGPDHAMSLEPDELRELVQRIRATEAMLGDGCKTPQPAELDTRAVARRSIVAARALAAGDLLTADALTVKRPGSGLSPARLPDLLGSRLARPIARDELLSEAHLEPRP